MITFPNAKINIGLNVLNKRSDGYHNIESLFYPIPLCDALEILPTDGEMEFSFSGIDVKCDAANNLVVKAFVLIQEKHNIPNVKIHLHKNIPFGAGLGGGSADAAFALKMLNDMFELNITDEQLIEYASSLGADCAFFIKNKPQIARGIGDELSDYAIDLEGKFLLLVKPDVAVPTANAYKYVTPFDSGLRLEQHLSHPINQWKNKVKNDFEASVFKQYPNLLFIKEQMYELRAEYAAMSGSGSSIFGLFSEKPQHNTIFVEHFCFEGVL